MKKPPSKTNAGYTKVPNWLKHVGLTGSEIAVYTVVKSHDWGRRPPLSYKRIADEAGVSERTAVGAIGFFLRAKMIVRQRTRSANVYSIAKVDPATIADCTRHRLPTAAGTGCRPNTTSKNDPPTLLRRAVDKDGVQGPPPAKISDVLNARLDIGGDMKPRRDTYTGLTRALPPEDPFAVGTPESEPRAHLIPQQHQHQPFSRPGAEEEYLTTLEGQNVSYREVVAALSKIAGELNDFERRALAAVHAAITRDRRLNTLNDDLVQAVVEAYLRSQLDVSRRGSNRNQMPIREWYPDWRGSSDE